MAEVPFQIAIVEATDALAWFPFEEDEYLELTDIPEAENMKEYLLTLPDGSCLPVRARDWYSVNSFTEWSTGVAIKNGTKLWYLYETGVIETFFIKETNFLELVQFVKPRAQDRHPLQRSNNIPLENPNKVVVISHGWSPELGPDYPLLRTLQSVAIRLGWKTVVPDYRASYKFKQRGRSERVKILFEELLTLDPTPERIVLVGHSQGGATSSLACTDRVVAKCNIKGLLLFGSECPLSLDAMNWIPKPEHVTIVHSEGDYTISIGEMEHTANVWKCEFISLKSTVPDGKRDCYNEDINHDFTAKDLVNPAVQILETFLRKCEA
jgi:pimeloyl-ACP methyl ester carboxylesterase